METPNNIYLFKKPNDVILGTWFLDPSEQFENIEYIRKDIFTEKAWSWIEDNILSSNQKDKSLLYYEQFKKCLEE